MIDEILLRDQTTGKNIIWANAEHGAKEIQAVSYRNRKSFTIKNLVPIATREFKPVERHNKRE